MLLTEIEDAMVAAIKAGLPDLKTVESYAGQLEGEIGTLTAKLPAVFVMYSGGTITRDAYGDATHVENFTTLVACRDLRGKKQSRTKDGGAYDILNALEATLTDQDLGLEIDSLTGKSVDLVFVAGSLVVYAIEWSTGYTT